MATSSLRYFVLHLSERDHRPSPGSRFAVQLPSRQGGPGPTGYFGADDAELVIDGVTIPGPVLDAARSLPLGYGDFVDEHGRRARPF
jgi:hypothetical protein